MHAASVFGLGNVGFWTGVNLAAALAAGEADADVAIVDFDSVDARAVAKGYPPWTLGQSKPDALVAAVRATFGAAVAARFTSVRAAAQSVPGLLRGRDVFLCVDSFGDAAHASRLAAGDWQCRATTGEAADGAHVLEVFPPGTATVEALLDDTAWRQAAERASCLAGTPRIHAAGAPHPLGSLTGALAVQAWRHRTPGEGAYRFTLRGMLASWAAIPGDEAAPAPEVVDADYDAPASALFAQVAAELGVAADDVLLTTEVPWVERRCGCGLRRGFERYPVLGECPRCGEVSVLHDAQRDLERADMAAAGDPTLRAAFVPAGLTMTARGAGGRTRRLALPFRFEDVPPLPGDDSRGTVDPGGRP